MVSYSTPRTDGYIALAGAVVRQTLADLEHGTPARRAAARKAIQNGHLDFWVDQLAPNGRAYRAVNTRLHQLAS